MIVGLLRDLDAAPVAAVMDRLRRFSARLEQGIFNPPNVAGWPGHRAWLSTTTFVDRWRVTEQLMNRLNNNGALDLTALAAKLHDPNEAHAAFTLPVALAKHVLSVPLDLLDLQSASLDFAGDLLNNPIPDAVKNGPAYARNLAKLFLADVPWYEWDLRRSNASRLLRSYLLALTRLPDFQLT